MLVCVLLCASCARDRGCSAHPVFPAPSDFQRDNAIQSSGAARREIAKAYSVVIVREGGRSSIPEAAVIEPISRGVLDTRFRGYDDRIWNATLSPPSLRAKDECPDDDRRRNNGDPQLVTRHLAR